MNLISRASVNADGEGCYFDVERRALELPSHAILHSVIIIVVVIIIIIIIIVISTILTKTAVFNYRVHQELLIPKSIKILHQTGIKITVRNKHNCIQNKCSVKRETG